MGKPSPQLIKKLRGLKALALDCDGVLTDTVIYYQGDGAWARRYSIRDGFGIKKLLDAGWPVTVITTSKSEDISERMKSLKVPHWYEGVTDKVQAWNDFLRKHNLQASEVGYMGDDEPDLELLKRAGVAFTVSDALPVVLKTADYVAKAPAGKGAVREVIELILNAKAKAKRGS
jgi:3-deoxy-D-manno-octulosonate 8-phosphate phosphatase (KDO 8-P phosphatase)